jgi:CDP-glucose 4,6-dehydratase
LCSDGDRFAGAWNFGPNDSADVQVSTLADHAARLWSNGARWQPQNSNGEAPEAHVLRIDSNKARQLLGWKPRLSLDDSVRLTIEWYRLALSSPDPDMYNETRAQIRAYADKLLSSMDTQPPA